jgi:hypothetical protein
MSGYTKLVLAPKLNSTKFRSTKVSPAHLFPTATYSYIRTYLNWCQSFILHRHCWSRFTLHAGFGLFSSNYRFVYNGTSWFWFLKDLSKDFVQNRDTFINWNDITYYASRFFKKHVGCADRARTRIYYQHKCQTQTKSAVIHIQRYSAVPETISSHTE